MRTYTYISILIFSFNMAVIFAQEINVSGKIIDSKGAPIKGAYIKLKDAGIIDTSNADGSFILTNGGVVNAQIYHSVLPTFSMRMSNGQLVIKAVKKNTLKIATYSLQGEEISSINKIVNSGTHTLTLPLRGAGIYLHRVELGNHQALMKGCSLEGLSYGTAVPSNGSAYTNIFNTAKIKKVFDDTIHVTKSGYLNQLIPMGNADTSGLEIAMSINAVELPNDHNFHGTNDEWVYFSGVLETDRGKEFGLMYTIFQRPYSVMLALIDPTVDKLYPAHLFGSGGDVGTTPDGYPDMAVNSGDSKFKWDPINNLYIHSSSNLGTPISVEINMKPTKEILFHGEDGYIPMGDNRPSGYFSLTSLLPVNGTFTIDNQQYKVTGGRVWMDRQWGDWTGGAYAWDWFSMRFDDGGALMLFQFRDQNEEPTFGNWTYRDKDGLVYYGTDFKVVAHRKIGRYPIDWTVSLPSLNAKFEVDPLFDDQRFSGIWEGWCDLSGSIGATQHTGHAIVELSAY